MKMIYRGKQQEWFCRFNKKITMSATFWTDEEGHCIMSCIWDENNNTIFSNTHNKSLSLNDKYYQLMSKLNKLFNDNQFDEISYKVINNFEYIH